MDEDRRQELWEEYKQERDHCGYGCKEGYCSGEGVNECLAEEIWEQYESEVELIKAVLMNKYNLSQQELLAILGMR